MTKRTQQSIDEEAIGKIDRAMKLRRFDCLFPGCTNEAISSHSQQKEGQLRAIAESGMVVGHLRNFYRQLRKRTGPQGRYKEVGIGQVSTSPSFCGKHDKELFSQIENKSLIQYNEQQSLLLFLRAASYEYAEKMTASIYQKMMLDHIGDRIPDQEVAFHQDWINDVDLFLERDGSHLLERAFQAIQSGSHPLNVVWKMIDRNLGVSCCSCINPLMDDFYNNAVYYERLECQPIVAFSVIPSTSVTHVVFCWLAEHDAEACWVRQKVNTLVGLEELINRFAFVESADTCVSPYLWRSLPDSLQASAIEAMGHSMFRPTPAQPPRIIRLEESFQIS